MAFSLAAERKLPTPKQVQAVVGLAGPMAEGRHARRKAVKLLGGYDLDLIAVLALTKQAYARAVGVAIILVHLAWPLTRVVAKALTREETLTCDDVRRLIGRAALPVKMKGMRI